MENLKNVKMPPGGTAAAGTLARVLLLGGAAVVGAVNSLFNVEGGHRAIVFNRLTGIKETVCCASSMSTLSDVNELSAEHLSKRCCGVGRYTRKAPT